MGPAEIAVAGDGYVRYIKSIKKKGSYIKRYAVMCAHARGLAGSLPAHPHMRRPRASGGACSNGRGADRIGVSDTGLLAWTRPCVSPTPVDTPGAVTSA